MEKQYVSVSWVNEYRGVSYQLVYDKRHNKAWECDNGKHTYMSRGRIIKKMIDAAKNAGGPIEILTATDDRLLLFYGSVELKSGGRAIYKPAAECSVADSEISKIINEWVLVIDCENKNGEYDPIYLNPTQDEGKIARGLCNAFSFRTVIDALTPEQAVSA